MFFTIEFVVYLLFVEREMIARDRVGGPGLGA
jgi:hypothetical protein